MVEFYDLKYSLKANVPHETMPLYPPLNVMRQCLSQDSCPFKFIKTELLLQETIQNGICQVIKHLLEERELNDWSLFLNYTLHGLFWCEIMLIVNSREWFWDLCDVRGTSAVTGDSCCDWLIVPPVGQDGCSLLWANRDDLCDKTTDYSFIQTSRNECMVGNLSPKCVL